jgi:hypothetical protein
VKSTSALERIRATVTLRPGVIVVCDIRQQQALPKSENRRYRTAIGDTVEPEPP